ncbi:hypothetical protein N7539_003697 [Penicillium diatomitis]|uniref:Uncharacterized protein n=1 Tax=Penicillium diatomitis TaxID=2819901 RepID=A0A9W9XCM2_9EURO|nr:uncharacterized protein N7539_003697 [Penicillium diatomitis]KAJ5488807.1 hypothetical protein N7539_003697 [Penicillium diatomitis]
MSYSSNQLFKAARVQRRHSITEGAYICLRASPLRSGQGIKLLFQASHILFEAFFSLIIIIVIGETAALAGSALHVQPIFNAGAAHRHSYNNAGRLPRSAREYL